MTDDDPQDVNDFFREEEDEPANRFYGVDIPSEPPSPYSDRVPSGYDPMGEIQLTGRVYRGLSSGRTPLWVLITSWILFGVPLLLLLLLLISGGISGQIAVIPVFIVSGLPLWILWRGTSAYISHNKRKRR
jgi:hypothetical protein